MTTHQLLVPGGHLAYEVHEPSAGGASGLTVLAVPGMGDLRGSYRHLVPALVGAGHRVVVTDLRGHGDSATTFDGYGTPQTAADVTALLEHLGPAVVLGSSMGAAAGVVAAAGRPDLVRGLVLLGPFVRNPPAGAALRLAMRVAMTPPWGRLVWKAYLPTLFAGRTPDDHAAYLAEVVGALRDRGRARAFSLTTRTSHERAEASLDAVRAAGVPVLVVMGERDPDFDSPADEAAWIADRLAARTLMVPEAGHYPHSQRADLVAPAVLAELARLDASAP